MHRLEKRGAPAGIHQCYATGEGAKTRGVNQSPNEVNYEVEKRNKLTTK